MILDDRKELTVQNGMRSAVLCFNNMLALPGAVRGRRFDTCLVTLIISLYVIYVISKLTKVWWKTAAVANYLIGKTAPLYSVVGSGLLHPKLVQYHL